MREGDHKAVDHGPDDAPERDGGIVPAPLGQEGDGHVLERWKNANRGIIWCYII